jgi:hypothetical protein
LVVVIAPPAPDPPVCGVGEHDLWLINDPAGEPLERVREIRRDIERLVRGLLIARRWMPFGASMTPSR